MKSSHKLQLISGLSIVAIINAAYLSYRSYQMRLPQHAFDSFCDINAQVSCTNVLASPYAEFFGVPFPMIALVVYPVILALAIMGLATEKSVFTRAIGLLSLGGIAFNSIVIYRETVYINAYCILCLICSAIILTIFALCFSDIRTFCQDYCKKRSIKKQG